MMDDNSTFFRAQHGEDRILAQELRGGTPYFVEVGSYNGESYSNTYYFEKALNWTGVLIEADPALHRKGELIRPGSQSVNSAVVAPGSPPTVSFEVVEGCQWVSSLSVSSSMLKRIEDIPTQITRVTVPAETLDHILERMNAPVGFGLLSIDVEGFEWPVLQGFSIDKWKPAVVILERNDHFPDRRIMRYMHSHGYGWRRTTGCNDWFAVDRAHAPGYAMVLAARYYLPKYVTFYKPIVNGPMKRTVKHLLRKTGLLDMARSLAGRRPAKARS